MAISEHCVPSTPGTAVCNVIQINCDRPITGPRLPAQHCGTRSCRVMTANYGYIMLSCVLERIIREYYTLSSKNKISHNKEVSLGMLVWCRRLGWPFMGSGPDAVTQQRMMFSHNMRTIRVPLPVKRQAYLPEDMLIGTSNGSIRRVWQLERPTALGLTFWENHRTDGADGRDEVTEVSVCTLHQKLLRR